VNIFPLLLNVTLNFADAANHLITIHTTAKSIVYSNDLDRKLTLGILMAVSKLALRGQYLTENSFSIIQQSSWQTLIRYTNEDKFLTSNKHSISVKAEDLF